MNKKYLIILLTFLSIRSYSQQIPNGNFEQWFFNNTTMSYEPNGWLTSNIGSVGDTGIRKYQPAHTGNFACGLKTNFVLGTYTSPAAIYTTFAVNAVPAYLTGYFKGNLALNDTTTIIIEFSKDSNVIADGTLFISQSQINYTKFSIPIDFFGTGIPDSCTISIIGGGFEIDDTLTDVAIDDLSLVYTSDIKNNLQKNSEKLQIYPNPASEILNIVSEEDYQSILVFNTSGQLVATYPNTTSISLIDYNAGLYFIQLIDDKNRMVARKSFIKN